MHFSAFTAVPDTIVQVSLQRVLIVSASLLLLLLILGTYYTARNLHAKHAHKLTKALLDATNTPSKSESTFIQETSTLYQLPEMKTVISEGPFCTVWRGTFSGIDVAFKCLAKQSKEQWENELHIFSNCNISHKNIVPFIAANDPESCELWLATEYCKQGTLRMFLETHELSWRELLTKAKDITAGLSFLHNDELTLGCGSKPPIVHQDLKSNNIFIKGDGTCVIGDFGLSMELGQDYLIQIYQNGQVRINNLAYMNHFFLGDFQSESESVCSSFDQCQSSFLAFSTCIESMSMGNIMRHTQK